MANILPPARLKELRKSQRARLFAAFGGVASVTGVIALIALLPSYLAVELGPHAASVSGGKKNATSTLAIIEAQNLVALMQPLLATTTPAEAIRAAIGLRPAGVHIDRIDYNKSAGLGTIVVGATAEKASDIEAYRAHLSGDSHFTQVTVPVSALAGATDGRFAITLNGHF